MPEFVTTHHGRFCGIVPIRIDMRAPEDIALEAKGGIFGEILLDVVEGLFGVFCSLMMAISKDFEPMFPILITGEEE